VESLVFRLPMIRFFVSFWALLFVAISHGATARNEGATLFVNEVKVLTLRASVGKSGPAARAKALASRLDGRSDLSLAIEGNRRSAKLYESGEVLILINKEEAERHGSSPVALANEWLGALRQAWSLPAIKPDKSQVMLPVKGTAGIDVIGRLARTAPLFVENKDVVKVSRIGARLALQATQAGETSIRIGEGEESAEIKIRVLPYAATFPQSFSVTVVGAPAAASSIKSVVEGAVRTRLAVVPGSTATWVIADVNSLQPGQKDTIAVKVKADGPNAYPSEGTVNVTVSNLGLAHRRETELWYCNDPENIKKPQSLFNARLVPDSPVRLLYHHINDSYQGLYIRVFATNKSERPAQVVILPGDSKDKNPVLAGVLAADPFFRSWFSGSGEVVTVAPGGSLPIAFRRLAPQETSSGLCYLRLLSGGPDALTVTAEAVAPYDLDERWQAATRTPTPWREVGASTDLTPSYFSEASEVIFPTPFKQEEFKYTAGGNFSFFRIGHKPIPREGGKSLDGNFGVIYNIQAKAENPTANIADIELVFEASAGYSGGIFLIDGEFVRLPLLQSKAEARLARFKLEPGGSKTISVATIPLSGSSYPATLVLRPVSSLPDLPGR
jgi:hypothetical protein